jgi:hypothetical protein
MRIYDELDDAGKQELLRLARGLPMPLARSKEVAIGTRDNDQSHP